MLKKIIRILSASATNAADKITVFVAGVLFLAAAYTLAAVLITAAARVAAYLR